MSILLLQGPTPRLLGLARGLAAEGREVHVDAEVDLGSMRGVRAAVAAVRPTVAVLTGTLDDPEACEADPNRAFAANAEAAINLAAACMEFDAQPVLISSAEVFGQRGGPWSEADAPEACSLLGESMLRGEKFLRRAAKRALVVRVGPVLEDGLAALSARLEPAGLEEADDDLVSPIGAYDLGRALHALAAAGVDGVVHAAAPSPPVSRAELLRRAAKALGRDPGLVRGVPSRALTSPRAQRAALLTDRLKKALAAPLMSLDEALAEAAKSAAPVTSAAPPVTEAAALVPATEGGPLELSTPKPQPAAHGEVLTWARGAGYGARLHRFRPGAHLGPRSLSAEITVHVVAGKVLLEATGPGPEATDHVLKPGTSARIPAGTQHRLVAIDTAELLEAGAAELDAPG